MANAAARDRVTAEQDCYAPGGTAFASLPRLRCWRSMLQRSARGVTRVVTMTTTTTAE